MVIPLGLVCIVMMRGEEDDDEDSINSCFYSGITNSTLDVKDLCVFTENLIESNPMWDNGCQTQYYCI